MKYLYYTIIPLYCILASLRLYSQSYVWITIETPNNTEISAKKLTSGDYSLPMKNSIKEAMEDYWGSKIQYQDEATWAYNCHGYAWQVTEGEDEVWIYTPNDDEFWNDGSYVEASSESEAEKVSYGYCNTTAMLPMCINCPTEYNCTIYVCPQSGQLCDHSAVTTSSAGYFISKWGSWCLVRHHMYDTPYLIQPTGLMYFKKCREVLNENITSDFTKEDCCEFILQDLTISNNSDVVLKTKNYDKYKQINEYIQLNGTFEIQLGSTLLIQ